MDFSAIKIIGVGSPHYADRIGWQACDWLQSIGVEELIPSLGITFETLDRPGPSLLESFRSSSAVVIIDALLSDDPPGSVRRIQVEELLREEMSLSSHHLGVAEALALADSLGELPERCVVFGVATQGEDGGPQGELTNITRASLLRELGTVLQKWVGH